MKYTLPCTQKLTQSADKSVKFNLTNDLASFLLYNGVAASKFDTTIDLLDW